MYRTFFSFLDFFLLVSLHFLKKLFGRQNFFFERTPFLLKKKSSGLRVSVMLEHAPITCVSIGCSVGVSVLSGMLSLADVLGTGSGGGSGRHHYAHHGSGSASFARSMSPFLSFPVGFFSSLSDAACVCVILFHMRVLERRWGSGRYLTFGLLTAIAGAILVLFLRPVTASVAGRHVQATLAGLAWATPVGAFLAAYFIQVPSLHSARLINTIPISDKWFLYLIAAKYLLLPQYQYGAATAATSLWMLRATLSAAGMGLGTALLKSKSGNKLMNALGFFLGEDSLVIRGVQWAFTRVFDGFASPSIEHTPVLPVAPDAGIPRELLRQQQYHQMASGEPTGPAPGSFAAEVDVIMEMQLGCTRQEAAKALAMSNGDVDMAAALIMDNMTQHH